MAEDVLDKVSITPGVWQRWNNFCHDLTKAAALKTGWRPTSPIPDEQAEVQEDGSLLLWVQPPGLARIEMRIAPGEWTWMDGRN